MLNQDGHTVGWNAHWLNLYAATAEARVGGHAE